MYLYGHAIKADVVDVFGSNLLTRLFRYFIICHNFWSFAVVLFSAARCPIQHFVGALVCLAILSKFLLPQRNKLLFFHLFIFIIFFYAITVQKQHIFLMWMRRLSRANLSSSQKRGSTTRWYNESEITVKQPRARKRHYENLFWISCQSGASCATLRFNWIFA